MDVPVLNFHFSESLIVTARTHHLVEILRVAKVRNESAL